MIKSSFSVFGGIAISFLLLSSRGFASGEISNWVNRPTVTTRHGQILGLTDKHTTWSWKGIPYAAPPEGPLRWKAPVEPEYWHGIRYAFQYASSAAQYLPIIGHLGSEDCLYLNIWRPKGKETGLPVYVFIHGGGNSIGTGSSPDYSGDVIASRGKMVYVTVNYRLGVFGWFRHPAVTGYGSAEDQSGNFGTLDLIQSLRWIRDNISAFGGDPGNVTIAGESAGAMNVLSLLTAPAAAGLFHRAVAESGLAIMRTTEEAENRSLTLLANLLVEEGKAPDFEAAKAFALSMSPYDINVYLRLKTPAELFRGIPTMVGGMAQWPSLFNDGDVLPASGYGVFASGTWVNKVPLLIGVNKDEMKLFRFLIKDPEPGTRFYELLSRYQSLMWRSYGLDTVAIAMTSNRRVPPVYAYRFDWGSPDAEGISVLPGKLGALMGSHHYAEIPFFLGTGSSQLSLLAGRTFSVQNRPGREKLTDLCMDYLANFARTGNPNGELLPEWAPWNPATGSEKYLILDATFTDLRISRGSDIVNLQSVMDLIDADLKEPERTEFLKILSVSGLFGL